MDRRHFTTEAVAEMYATEPEVVRRWIRQGRLTAVNVGHPNRPIYRISDEALTAFNEANTVGAA